MSQHEYIKLIEKEIQRINKIIDQKIMSGEEYIREARDHKLLLRKLRVHKERGLFNKFFPSLAHLF